MEIEQTNVAGAMIIRPKVFGDNRGFFLETYQQERYDDAFGFPVQFVQDNHSRSSKGVLRGLHFQRTRPQGKLVRVVSGRVFDVAVDIRVDSPTFGQWAGIVLSGENQAQFWVPPGLAHGFAVLSEYADFEYKCTDYYLPADEGCLHWSDPTVGIDWPIAEPIVSEKDASAPLWGELFQ